ncbi:MAG TPA: hypothetical protein VK481_01965 [Gemmatimonadaceae bacterium]|nr:hypothetical protein [Gemmatimonadaceae bacterium]
MALPAINATCPNCATRFTGFPKRSFLGFQKLKCRKCSNDVLYPLTSGYRAIYRVILVLMVVGTWLSLQQGVTPTPGFLGIATIVALYQDSKLRKSTKPTPAPRVSPTT